MRSAVLALVLAVLTAGCLASEAPPSARDASSRPAPVDMGLSGCIEFGAGSFVSLEHARSLLPDGFEPADASTFLGMPTESGRGLVLTGQIQCEGSVLDGAPVAWSDLIVLVRTPTVDGVDLDLADGRHDFYQLAQYTNGLRTLAALQAVGFRAELADVHLAPAVAAALPAGHGQTDVDGAEVMRFDVVGGPSQPYRLFARFWHDAPDGLVVVEHERSPTVMHLGTLSRCSAAAGSLFAEAFGATDCAGPDAIGGVFPERSDFQSTLHAFPGVHAAT